MFDKMKRRYKILTSKTCNGTTFRIVYDPDGIASWHYKIQYETGYRRKYKKLWNFQSYHEAVNGFDCEIMLKRVDWEKKVENER